MASAAGAVMMLWLNRRAFESWFFAEAFVYLGTYVREGSYLASLFTAHGHIFYRPSLWAVNLAANLMLPPDAAIYHWRNFAGIVICLILLHRVLLQLVPTVGARVAGVVFFAASKVHFTTIGYIATFSTILVCMWALAMSLCFVRWIREGQRRHYAGTVLFLALLIGSKDYGAAAILILPALKYTVGGTGEWRRLAVMIGVPFVLLLAAYSGVRSMVVPGTPQEGPYRAAVRPRVLLMKLAGSAAVATSLTASDVDGVLGHRGVVRLLPGRMQRSAEGALFVIIVMAGAVVLRRCGPPPLTLLSCSWATAFVLPTFLAANQQPYYFNEVATAGAFLVASAFANGDLLSRRLIILFLVFSVTNMEAAEASSGYTWQYVAREAEQIRPVVERFRESSIRRLVVRSADPALTAFALTADGLAPMIPELMGKREDLRVDIVARNQPVPPAPDLVVIDVDPALIVVYDGTTSGTHRGGHFALP